MLKWLKPITTIKERQQKQKQKQKQQAAPS